jgi:putative salt-induced outer membrane protein YdiY
MKIKNYILIAMACWVPAVGFAAEAAAEPAKTNANPWVASAALGLTLTSGNSDTLLFTANVQAAKKWADRNEISLGADIAYGENDGTKNNETEHGYAQYNRLFSDRLYAYVRVDALHDGIADIDYRITASPGLGYYFIKNTKHSLRGEIGPGYVDQRLAGDHNSFATLRLAERYELKLTDRARLWESVEFLPQIDKWSNFIVNAEIGLETDISKHFSMVTYVQDTYQSEPAKVNGDYRKKNDLKLVAGLKYKF